MQLPFAVYTAQQGYGWVSGLEHGRATLERFRKALGKLPEFDFGDPLSCGAVNSGDTVVAYRFLKAEKWDFRGREALYLAVTFFPRSVAGEIDIEQLLGMEPFTRPMREPPPSLEYCGGGSSMAGYDPERDTGAGAVAVDLSCAGSVFQKAFPGTLKISREENAKGGRCMVAYRRLAPEPVLIVPAPVAMEGPVAVPDRTVLVHKKRFDRRIAAFAATLALMTCGVCLWMVHGSRDKRVERTNYDAICLNQYGETSEWLFDVGGMWRGLSGALQDWDSVSSNSNVGKGEAALLCLRQGDDSREEDAECWDEAGCGSDEEWIDGEEMADD